ncbi:hypothetical protein, partial [Rhodovibrio sodomensis]|uniref:hypothetical protein n=1 Tax=Rhodovibrio sodomensis TaxID=1088 RepID=UPI001A91E9E7
FFAKSSPIMVTFAMDASSLNGVFQCTHSGTPMPPEGASIPSLTGFPYWEEGVEQDVKGEAFQHLALSSRS